MDRRFTTLLVFLCLICSGTVLPADAQMMADWETIASQRTIRMLTATPDTVWAVSSGGLVAISDPAQPPTLFTNTDGLGATDLYDFLIDANGDRWVAAGGRLLRQRNGLWTEYAFRDTDNERFDALSLADDGEFIWVGSSLGLVRFAKEIDGGQIQAVYDQFGDLNPSVAVNDVQLIRDTLWLGTADGLAYAPASNPIALFAPTTWSSISRRQFTALGADTIRAIGVTDNGVYLGLPSGLFQYLLRGIDSILTPVAGLGGGVFTVVVAGDSALVGSSTGLSIVRGTTANPLTITGLNGGVRAVLESGSLLWLATTDGQLLWTFSGTTTDYPWLGLPSNDLTDVALLANGELRPLDRLAGVARPQGEPNRWETISFFRSQQTNRLLATDDNLLWVGTFGAGLIRIDGTTVTRYDSTGTTLRGNTDGGPNNFVVIFDLVADNQFLYTACYRSFNNHAIAFVNRSDIDNPANWDSLGTNSGLGDTFIRSLDVFGPFLAVGTEANGVYICNLGPDPTDPSDDICQQLTVENSGLISDEVRILRFAESGELWVGTNFGLSRIDPTIGERFFSTVTLPTGFGPDITDIDIDSRGNLWLGSVNGLLRFHQESGTTDLFTTESSPLVSDDIRGVTLDALTGDLYIATGAGLSVRRGNLGPLTTSGDSLVAIPNPYNPRRDPPLQFNFAGSGSLSIFTVAGERVFGSSTLQWDGRNEAGRDVVSGVYIFVIENEDGVVGRGKVLLVRD